MDIVLTGVCLIGFIFLPTWIAILRKHKAKAAILMLNIVSVGVCFALFPAGVALWLAAIVWSFTGNTRRNDREMAQLLAASIHQ
jgi:hypothetical protein